MKEGVVTRRLFFFNQWSTDYFVGVPSKVSLGGLIIKTANRLRLWQSRLFRTNRHLSEARTEYESIIVLDWEWMPSLPAAEAAHFGLGCCTRCSSISTGFC